MLFTLGTIAFHCVEFGLRICSMMTIVIVYVMIEWIRIELYY